MILTSTSETPSATAAAIPGAEEETRRRFKRKETLVDAGPTAYAAMSNAAIGNLRLWPRI
jgi:hypothetical protein